MYELLSGFTPKSTIENKNPNIEIKDVEEVIEPENRNPGLYSRIANKVSETAQKGLVILSLSSPLNANVATTAGLAVTGTAIALILQSCDDPKDTPDILKLNLHTLSYIDIAGKTDVKLRQDGRSLKIGNTEIANCTEDCEFSAHYQNESPDKNIIGSDITKTGIIVIKATSTKNRSITESGQTEIKNSTQESPIQGLEKLQSIPFKVDDAPINLMNYITLGNGVSIEKVTVKYPHKNEPTEINKDGAIMEFPGSNLPLTFYVNKGGTTETYPANINVSPKTRESIESTLTAITPEEIIPILGNVEVGDKNIVNEHIKPTLVAEGYKMVETMSHYGTRTLTPEQYKNHQNNLLVVYRGENADGKYEFIGGGTVGSDEHARIIDNITTTYLPNTKKKAVVSDVDKPWRTKMAEYRESHPNEIILIGSSANPICYSKSEYTNTYDIDEISKLGRQDKTALFVAGTNIETSAGKRKITNDKYDLDNAGCYSLASMANSDKNEDPNIHISVTVGTDKDGYVNQTQANEGSKYPEGFSTNSLLAGRESPYLVNGMVYGETGKYTTSFTNYFNLAQTGIIYQLNPSIKNIDDLLSIAYSTSLSTDQIKYGENVITLPRLNIKGSIMNLMPKKTSYNINFSDNVDGKIELENGEYPLTILDIPGAKMEYKGTYTTSDKTNGQTINDPVKLSGCKRYFDEEEARKLGYKTGNQIKGYAIAVVENGKKLEEVKIPITITLN